MDEDLGPFPYRHNFGLGVAFVNEKGYLTSVLDRACLYQYVELFPNGTNVKNMLLIVHWQVHAVSLSILLHFVILTCTQRHKCIRPPT